MKVYRNTIYWMITVCIISLPSSYFLDTYACSKFWSNFLLGVFASGLLVLISSAVGYKNEKNTLITRFHRKVQYLLLAHNQYRFKSVNINNLEYLYVYDQLQAMLSLQGEYLDLYGNFCFFTEKSLISKAIKNLNTEVMNYFDCSSNYNSKLIMYWENHENKSIDGTGFIDYDFQKINNYCKEIRLLCKRPLKEDIPND